MGVFLGSPVNHQQLPSFLGSPPPEVCSKCWWPWDVPDSDGEACIMDVLRVAWRLPVGVGG